MKTTTEELNKYIALIEQENAKLRMLVHELKIAVCDLPMESSGYRRAQRAVAAYPLLP